MGIYFFEVNLRNLKTNPYKIYSCTNTYPILSRVLTSLIRLTPPLLRREREKKKLPFINISHLFWDKI